MSDKVKSSVFYVAAIAVMLYGCVAMIGYGVSGEKMLSLIVWAIAYGGLMVGAALYGARSATMTEIERLNRLVNSVMAERHEMHDRLMTRVEAAESERDRLLAAKDVRP